MAKKSFKDVNPAMQFISAAQEPALPAPAAAKAPEPAPVAKASKTAKPPRPAAPDSDERKSKRLNLLLQPSTLNGLAKIAHMRRTSVNDLINTVLKAYNDAEAETIKRYDSFFGGE